MTLTYHWQLLHIHEVKSQCQILPTLPLLQLHSSLTEHFSFLSPHSTPTTTMQGVSDEQGNEQALTSSWQNLLRSLWICCRRSDHRWDGQLPARCSQVPMIRKFYLISTQYFPVIHTFVLCKCWVTVNWTSHSPYSSSSDTITQNRTKDIILTKLYSISQQNHTNISVCTLIGVSLYTKITVQHVLKVTVVLSFIGTVMEQNAKH